MSRRLLCITLGALDKRLASAVQTLLLRVRSQGTKRGLKRVLPKYQASPYQVIAVSSPTGIAMSTNVIAVA